MTATPTPSEPRSDSAQPVDDEQTTALLGLAVDWLWEMDAQFRVTGITELNPGRPAPTARKVLGKTPWECGALNLDEAAWERHRQDLLKHREFRNLELQRRAADGNAYWTQINGRPRFDRDGRFVGYQGVALDITNRKTAEQALQDTRSELDATLKAIPDLMFEIDAEGRYYGVHAPRPELLAVPIEGLIGRRVRDVVPPEVLDVCIQAMEQATRFGKSYGHRYRLMTQSGERWFELSMASRQVRTGEAPRFVALVRDITDHKDTEARLEEMAFYDPLTGLPNRRLLLDRIEQIVALMARSREHAALLFLDLDGFKQINDRHGHAAGDEVLQVQGRRLRALVRQSDPLGRLSGDEFLLMLPQLGETPATAGEAANRLGQEVLRSLREPIRLTGAIASELSGSVGVLLFQGRHAVPELLRQADALMYRAKAEGKNRLVTDWLSRL